MFVIKYRKIFFILSSIMVIAALALVVFSGLTFGIDFTGGSILEVEYVGVRPEASLLRERINSLPIGEYRLQPTGESGFVIRTKELSESERVGVLELLNVPEAGEIVEKRFNTVGPVIGEELKQKAYIAIIIVVLAIILFIAFSFRKVSKPVSSWKYGLAAIVALIHDIIIPTGFFVILGHIAGAEIDILFVTALLAILGFSVNDTIIVFDRVRENLSLNQESRNQEPFETTVGRSLNQTFARSINTSFTTLIVLLALYIIGGDATKYFALTLIIGVIAGTYSSIFLASPLLVFFGPKKE